MKEKMALWQLGKEPVSQSTIRQFLREQFKMNDGKDPSELRRKIKENFSGWYHELVHQITEINLDEIRQQEMDAEPLFNQREAAIEIGKSRPTMNKYFQRWKEEGKLRGKKVPLPVLKAEFTLSYVNFNDAI